MRAGSLPRPGCRKYNVRYTLLTVDKRDAILEAAERSFYAGGFHATGIDTVVAAAGVTPRTLYRHFRSKEALVRAVLERREARYLALLDEALEAGTDDVWSALFARLGDWFRDQGARGCLFLRAFEEYVERDEAIADCVVAHKQRVLERFRARFEAAGAGDAAGRAESLMLLIEGAVALAPLIGADAAERRATTLATDLLGRDGRRHQGGSP